jgi:uncharacterized membrane protein
MTRGSGAASARIELAIGRLLRAGVALSTVCLSLGLVARAVPAGRAFSDLLLTFGILVLLATPAARVVLSVVEFGRERDWLFVVLAAIVLLELAASVAAALMGS